MILLAKRIFFLALHDTKNVLKEKSFNLRFHRETTFPLTNDSLENFLWKTYQNIAIECEQPFIQLLKLEQTILNQPKTSISLSIRYEGNENCVENWRFFFFTNDLDQSQREIDLFSSFRRLFSSASSLFVEMWNKLINWFWLWGRSTCLTIIRREEKFVEFSELPEASCWVGCFFKITV